MKLNNPSLDPRPGSSNLWIEMKQDAAKLRLPVFATVFFDELFKARPDLDGVLRYAMWPSVSDVYAFHDAIHHGFVVQIDCDIELIIVGSANDTAEFGEWGRGLNAQVQSALECLLDIIEVV
jgi:hypothetical protein